MPKYAMKVTRFWWFIYTMSKLGFLISMLHKSLTLSCIVESKTN